MIDMPEKLKDFLTLKFLSMGLEIYIGDSPKAVESILEKKGKGYLFVRVDQLNSNWLQFLARLRQYKPDDSFNLLILSDKSDREFIQTLLLLNVTSLIPGNIEQEEIYKRLHKVLTSGDVGHEQRQFQRVTPRENDDISINLSVPNSSTIITGKIINLSIGGIAIQLSGTGEARWLGNGLVIESAQIRMNGKIGMTGLKIVAIKDTIIAAKFMRPTEYFFNLLGRYLLERLSTG